jgi:MFS family permease
VGEVSSIVRSAVPARMDRLPWSRFHTRLVVALGVAWVLDGLEITVASLIGPVLQSRHTLALSSVDVGRAASVYLAGEVVGALAFGYLADRLGRRRLFMATLGLYLAANGLTALAVDYTTLLIFRFLAGAGIGGEYSAINSAIDEINPGALPRPCRPGDQRQRTGWARSSARWAKRCCSIPRVSRSTSAGASGCSLAPSSASRCGHSGVRFRKARAGYSRTGTTTRPSASSRPSNAKSPRTVHAFAPAESCAAVEVRATGAVGYVTLARVLFATYPSRSVLSVALMATQSFLYNAIFFSYGLVPRPLLRIAPANVPRFFYAFAFGNLLGPLTLGRFFDTVGRKPMIAGTYVTAGILLAVSGYLFSRGALTATTQTMWWSATFFIASAAASSAYLTVSEIFPLEIRAQAIALFFAIAQVVGATGPWIFGVLIGDQQHPDPHRLFVGYVFGAGMMVLGGVAEAVFGVKAERAALEDVAKPLSLIGGDKN